MDTTILHHGTTGRSSYLLKQQQKDKKKRRNNNGYMRTKRNKNENVEIFTRQKVKKKKKIL